MRLHEPAIRVEDQGVSSSQAWRIVPALW